MHGRKTAKSITKILNLNILQQTNNKQITNMQASKSEPVNYVHIK